MAKRATLVEKTTGIAPVEPAEKPKRSARRKLEDPRLDRNVEGLLMAANDVRMINMQVLDDYLRRHKLTERGLDIITLVGVGFDRPSKLNKYFGIFPSAITIETDKLEAAGYITRTPDKTDRRVTLLDLTRRGQIVRRDSLSLVNKAFRERLADVVPEEFDICIKVLRQIIGPLHLPTRPPD